MIDGAAASPPFLGFPQACSGVDAVVHAWHVVPTFLTFDDPHSSVYFDWQVTKLYNII
jgi:hypothetical protein